MRSRTAGRLTRGLRRLGRAVPTSNRQRPDGRRRPRATGERPAPRIAVVGTDPYVPYLVRIRYPNAEISEHGDLDQLEALLASPPDAVVVEVDDTSGERLWPLASRAPVVAIARGDQAEPAVGKDAAQEVLLRPFAAHELHAALDRALGIPPPPTTVADGAPRVAGRLRISLGPLRLAAVGLTGVVLLVGGPVGALDAAVWGVLFAYLLGRFLIRREGPGWVVADTVVTAAALGLDGGLSSPHLLLVLVVAAEAGLLLNVKRGILAALVLAVVGGVTVLLQEGAMAFTLQQFLSAFSLPLLLAVIGGTTGRIWGGEGSRDLAMLRETNRILSTLYRITRTIPGGLETGNVVAAALAEMRASLDLAAGAVFLEEAGLLSCVGAFGVDGVEGLALDTGAPEVHSLLRGQAREISEGELPGALAQVLDLEARWWVVPLVNEGVDLGVLLASPRRGAEHREQRLYLEELAAEASVALANARLFTRVGEFSADQERRRLARELHDGVSQSLTHLRREVEYLKRHGGAGTDLPLEADRLLRVIDRAGQDVRRTIEGLRSVAAAGGLAAALREYVRDLRALQGPEVTLEIQGTARFDPEVESEVFRIAQEAAANAFRHAEADQVRIALRAEGSGLALTVADDGIGLKSDRTPDGQRMGLRAMRERAEIIGADLTITAPPEGGTLVRMEYEPPGVNRSSD